MIKSCLTYLFSGCYFYEAYRQITDKYTCYISFPAEIFHYVSSSRIRAVLLFEVYEYALKIFNHLYSKNLMAFICCF